MTNIGEAIAKIRKEKKIKQSDLAKSAVISKTSMSQIEIGNTIPRPETISKICAALEVSEEYLILSSIEEPELPMERRHVFRVLMNSLLPLLKERW